MQISKLFGLALAVWSTTVFAKLHFSFAQGGHNASTDGLNHCLDMYQEAVQLAYKRQAMFKKGDWKPLQGVDNYDHSINNSRFNCTGAEDSVIEDGKKRSGKSRTPYLQACMPMFRSAAREGARWAHCTLKDHDLRHGTVSGSIYMGWSPAGFEICNDDAKKGMQSTGPCRITRDQSKLFEGYEGNRK
ncbi:hypothetical protein CKM354_001231800 [Cercospora kikuchii]|uniref:Uncharacterized protein n=1 Tax=Cercospora kikuchii TaxID=84275 RepID=A0A9P3L0Z6_9PEZI|nr:uncharacterized protein CKM354_001231800 [Cercospora kikuchii]GIZ49286.1 hypothetical protein CKM354_001231800 [Cercospora kikuchii]